MKPTITPLRYPGGKTWLLPYVTKFLTINNIKLDTIVEPFAGSASISIGLLTQKLAEYAYICENDPLIFSFWNSVFKKNDELVETIKNLEINLDTWYDFRKYISIDAYQKYNELELATAFIFYNRTNFSGIIKAGPLGGKRQLSKYKLQCRFNVNIIVKKIKALDNLSEKITLKLLDGIELLENFNDYDDIGNVFFYVDPPYYNAGKMLYRYYFTDKEHRKLANVLNHLKQPWLLSYDNAEFIQTLYQNDESFSVYTNHQSGHFRKGVEELLISNYRIPPLKSKINSLLQIPGESNEEIKITKH